MARNRKNILLLAEFLNARGKRLFDMDNWYPGAAGTECNTAACVGGSACILWPSVNENKEYTRLDTDIKRLARKLGISPAQAAQLCYPDSWDGGAPLDYTKVTLKNAVATLKRLAKTGKVSYRKSERR